MIDFEWMMMAKIILDNRLMHQIQWKSALKIILIMQDVLW